MEINEDVVIVGKLTVAGDVQVQNLESTQDVSCGRDYLFDGQEGKLIDNDSNAHLTDISCASITIGGAGAAPHIADATSEADAVTKLNSLLTWLRTTKIIGS